MTAVPDLQVEAAHYAFTAYMPKRRWASVWHQMTEVERFEPRSVFELGPGPGLLQRLISSPERTVVTADIDPSLHPAVVADAGKLPFADQAFDVSCVFQVLEHVPFEASVVAFRALERVEIGRATCWARVGR